MTFDRASLALAAAVLLIGVLGCSDEQGSDEKGSDALNTRTVAEGDDSRIAPFDEPRIDIVGDDDAWSDLWSEHKGEPSTPPTVDFDVEYVVAVFYASGRLAPIKITSLSVDSEGQLDVELRRPRRTGDCTETMDTHESFQMVALERPDDLPDLGEVEVDRPEEGCDG